MATDPKHVSPDRFWANVHSGLELELSEHAHLAECPDCFDVFLTCLHSVSFNQVLTDLNRRLRPEHEEPVSRKFSNPTLGQ